MQLTVDAGALENRRRLLTEMEKEYEGFSKAVKTVMQAQSGLRGIHGPVASLVKTDGKYSLAIEIALGAGLQNIVVDREEDAKAAIGYLKQRDAGRATFLPLTAIRGDELRERGVESEFGFVGLASRLVSFDPRYQNIVYNLLGRTVVAEDLDCGIAMARKYKNAFRIVTLDGQVINRGGSMTGGSTSRSAGVLSRAAELEKLSGPVRAPAGAARRRPEAEEDAGRELSAAQYELETAEAQRRQAEDEVLRLEGAKSHFDILLALLRGEPGESDRRAGEPGGPAGGQRAARRRRPGGDRETGGRRRGLRARAEEALSGQSELLAQSGALTEEISGKKSGLAALAAEREATARSAADLRRPVRGPLRRPGPEGADGGDLSAEHRRRPGGDRGAAGELEALAEQGAALRERLAAISGGEERPGGGADRQEPGRPGDERDLLNLERAVARLDQRRATSAMEEKQILDRLWEHYELSHSDATALRIELESVPKANRRIGELKRDIAALGTPNIGAIEEFDRVNTRYTYLTDQRNDVEKAKGELEGIIGRSPAEMTEIFAQQFQLLSRELPDHLPGALRRRHRHAGAGGRGGYPGLRHRDQGPAPGQDPQDHLPPLRRGEGLCGHRAVLRHSEGPPHALLRHGRDRGGAGRRQRHPLRPLYAALAGKTQFIVITHRRGTMEEADVLYGVTMQEQGVSKILTINMNDMAKELKIK